VSPRLPVVEARDLVRVARKLGFELGYFLNGDDFFE
jgi:hypothetical protein